MQLCTKLAMSTYTINFYQNLTFKMQKNASSFVVRPLTPIGAQSDDLAASTEPKLAGAYFPLCLVCGFLSREALL